MSFNIVEKYIQGKSKIASECEDRIIVNDNFVCAVDGATSKSDMTFDGKKQGVISAEIIEYIFSYLAHDCSVFDFIKEVNSKYNNFYISNNLPKHMDISPVDRLNASVVIYSDYRKELWLIGDCQAILDNTKITNPKLIDSVLSNLRAFVIETLINQGVSIEELLTNDLGRKEILPYLKEQTNFQNNHFNSIYSYAVLDGYPIDKKQVKVYKIDEHSKNIILATDGYPEIFESLIETEKYLEYILKEDPLCYSIYKSTKGFKEGNFSFDDRAYIKIELRHQKMR